MDVLNSLIYYDKQLLLFLHSKGYSSWDNFWIFITNPLHWVPLLFILFYLGNKIFGVKKTILISIYTSLSTALAFIIVNLIKNNIQRLRPINDSSINNSIRILINANDFSFVSGHSAISFTFAFISYWTLKKYYNYAFLVFLFPLLFAYSRIYLAAHFPIDIIFGMFLGFIIAKITFKIMNFHLLIN